MSTSQISKAEENELDRYVRARRASQMSLGSGERESVGSDKVAERELALPDVAMELPTCVPDDHCGQRSGPSRIHLLEAGVTEFIPNPVPDVALPSSPTSSVSSSGVPPEYFQMDQSEVLEDDSGSVSG